jgi:hypothetical protein
MNHLRKSGQSLHSFATNTYELEILYTKYVIFIYYFLKKSFSTLVINGIVMSNRLCTLSNSICR